MDNPTKEELRRDARLYPRVTAKTVLSFMHHKKISVVCERCDTPAPWWFDTGEDDGFVPRITAMPNTPAGMADQLTTFQMPIVRMVCSNCGNIRIHAMYVIDRWLAERELTSEAPE